MAAVGADDFLRAVLRSGLLSRDVLTTALRTAPADARDQAPALADHLVREGLLTPFQVQKLMRGLTLGLVLGPYHLQAPVGRGGMGTVYLARDTRNGQHVALKVLPPKRARAEERYLARFRREMELSQRVLHPHLALFLDAGVHRDVHYIVLEFIPGQTLYRVVQQGGPLAVPRAARLFAEIASALEQAHVAGVIHRDLKPSNLMVTPNDHAKVLDLGLAFMQGEEGVDLEVTGGKGYVVGSIDYMAPEQTRDPTAVDARSDLYALGCCLYFALTGRPPFPGGTVREKAHAHRHADPEPVQVLNPGVPDGFVAIARKLMAKAPADRYAGAAEVADELRPWSQAPAAPVEEAGDATYREAVRHAVEDWPKEAVEASDSVLFDAGGEEKSTANVAGLLSAEPDDRTQRWLWWAAVGLSAVSLLCLLGLGLLALIR